MTTKIIVISGEELQKLPCSECGQIHADSSEHYDRLTLSPKCHDEYGVVAVYDRQENVLALFCGFCSEFVAAVEPK